MVKGLVAGLVGGLAAAWVMDRVETARRSLSDADASAPRLQAEQERGSARGAPREQSEDSTVKVARLITRRVVGRDLAEEDKEKAGLAVHYAFGGAVGADYGALAEAWPEATSTAGMRFGATVWLLANEIGVPAFGLGPPATEVPVSEHAFSLSNHLVYGLTTDAVRRVARGMLERRRSKAG